MSELKLIVIIVKNYFAGFIFGTKFHVDKWGKYLDSLGAHCFNLSQMGWAPNMSPTMSPPFMIAQSNAPGLSKYCMTNGEASI